MTTETITSVATAIEGFVAKVQEGVDEGAKVFWKDNYETFREVYTVRKGKRYAKVVAGRPNDAYSGSVFAFIDMSTGDVYKPEGWAKPAKGVRGNVLSERNGLEAVQFTPGMGLAHIWYAK